VDVSIEIENIGGPSAGTMFALGIIDKLTSEDEANGEVIAGTGTMSPEGTVGPDRRHRAEALRCAPGRRHVFLARRATATRWSATCPTA